MAGLALIAGLGLLAFALRLPGRIVAAAIAFVWLLILTLHGLAPGSRLAAIAGGDIRIWLLAGGLVALLLAYRAGLRHLRARAVPLPPTLAVTPIATEGITGAELDRYARHLVLREIGGPGQMRLRDAKVLVVGAGALGSPVCLYLAAAGVGEITLADDDRVELSNLQRQVIFRAGQRGLFKADAAAANMAALNPHVKVTPLSRRITMKDGDLIAGHDLVLDGTDSFASRETVNRLCAARAVPLIAGSISQWEGQLALYDPAQGGPCMACLFPQPPAPGLAPSCAEAGVIGPLPGVIGSLMALEAIKHLTGAGQGMRGRMLIFDGLYGESRMITTMARNDCPVCGASH